MASTTSKTIQSIKGVVLGTAAIGALDQALNLFNNKSGAINNDITFPNDLIQTNSNRNFYFGMKFETYVKRSVYDTAFSKPLGGIKLPLPNQLKDHMAVDYSTPSLGAGYGGAAEQLTNSPMSNPGAGLLGLMEQGLQGGALEAVKNVGGGRAYEAVSQLSGVAVNPFLSVVFKSPTFKPHSFSWRFIPKSEQESGNIRDIVKLLQYNMLPGLNQGSGLLFSYPSIVKIGLFPSDEFLYRFKPCVIKSVNVNYSPGNAPSFYKRLNAPTIVEVSVDLLEIEYWTRESFTKTVVRDGRHDAG